MNYALVAYTDTHTTVRSVRTFDAAERAALALPGIWTAYIWPTWSNTEELAALAVSRDAVAQLSRNTYRKKE